MKKLLLTIIIMFSSVMVFSKNYYLDASNGSDANNGRSDTTAWRSIKYLNTQFSIMAAGDSILFKRGQTFEGAIVLTRGDINFGSYGTGAIASISGLSTLSNWIEVKPGLFKAFVMAPNDLRYLSVDGTPAEWSTYPSSGDGLNSYFYIDSFDNNSNPQTIVCNQIADTPNLEGEHILIQGETWYISEARITKHVGKKLYYVPGRGNLQGYSSFFRDPKAGSGFTFVNNKRYCKKFPQWAYDSVSHEVYMFFGTIDPKTKLVQAATQNILIDGKAFSNVSFDNLEFKGANRILINFKNGNGNLKVTNCIGNGAGARGLLWSNTPNITVLNSTWKNILSIPLRLPTNQINNAWVQGNKLLDNCPYKTMYYNGEDIDGDGITLGMNNTRIIDNFINRAGYSGVWVSGSASNVWVEGNEVTAWGACSNDCGAYYNHYLSGRIPTTNAPVVGTNRTWYNNYAHDAYADRYGFKTIRPSSLKFFYNDDGLANTIWKKNYGISSDIGFANNNVKNVTLIGNIVIAKQGINIFRKRYGTISNLSIINNNISNLDSNTNNYYHINDSLGGQSIPFWITGVTIDSNLTNTVFAAETYKDITANPNGYKVTPYSNLPAWRTATTKSATDKAVPFKSFTGNKRMFVINWTDSTVTKTLPGEYVDDYGNSYNGTITQLRKTAVVVYYKGPVKPPVDYLYKIKPRYNY